MMRLDLGNVFGYCITKGGQSGGAEKVGIMILSNGVKAKKRIL